MQSSLYIFCLTVSVFVSCMEISAYYNMRSSPIFLLKLLFFTFFAQLCNPIKKNFLCSILDTHKTVQGTQRKEVGQLAGRDVAIECCISKASETNRGHLFFFATHYLFIFSVQCHLFQRISHILNLVNYIPVVSHHSFFIPNLLYKIVRSRRMIRFKFSFSSSISFSLFYENTWQMSFLFYLPSH